MASSFRLRLDVNPDIAAMMRKEIAADEKAVTRPIRQAEVGSTKTMLYWVKAKFDRHPERLVADTA